MSEFSHFDESGQARMVDVGSKPATQRVARAQGLVQMKSETLRLIRDREIQKGDVLELARVAGIMATKRTSDLIPLCHPLRIDAVEIGFSFPQDDTIQIESTVSAVDRTGVEMEALNSVAVTALTIYDMCKSVDRGMTISQIRLMEKKGGKSGHYLRNEVGQDATK